MLALMDRRASLSLAMHPPPCVFHESGLDHPAVVCVSRSRKTASASMVDWDLRKNQLMFFLGADCMFSLHLNDKDTIAVKLQWC